MSWTCMSNLSEDGVTDALSDRVDQADMHILFVHRGKRSYTWRSFLIQYKYVPGLIQVFLAI